MECYQYLKDGIIAHFQLTVTDMAVQNDEIMQFSTYHVCTGYILLRHPEDEKQNWAQTQPLGTPASIGREEEKIPWMATR